MPASQESWDAVYLGGSKIGHMQPSSRRSRIAARSTTGSASTSSMRLKRQNDESLVKLMYGTIETLDGEVLRLDTRTQAGETQDIRVHGDVINHRMKLIMEGTGRSQSRIIPWAPDVRGPYGAEQSMARQPMKENEKRPLRIFMPELNKIVRRDSSRPGRSSRSSWATARNVRCCGSIS